MIALLAILDENGCFRRATMERSVFAWRCEPVHEDDLNVRKHRNLSPDRLCRSIMQAHFRRIRTRRGPKKAAVAVAHSLFVRCHTLIAHGTQYKDLGPMYLDERARQRMTQCLVQRLVQRLEKLGYSVALTGAA